jgi:hypothetical protein
MKKIILIMLFSVCSAGFVFYIYSTVLIGGDLKIPLISNLSGGQKAVGGDLVLVLDAANISQGIAGGQMQGGNYKLLGGATPATTTLETAKNLSNAHCYPNPFKPSLGHNKITFTDLPRNIEIKIYTISGELAEP